MVDFVSGDNNNVGATITTSGTANATTRYTFTLPLTNTMFTKVKHAIPLGKIKTDLRVDLTFNILSKACISVDAAVNVARIENPRVHYTEL